MRVLIACEESQTVCKAFRAKGHDSYSCDIQECSGGHPEWHYQMDVFEVIERHGPWDMMIAHPPCTFMSKAGARWMYPTAGNISVDRYNKAVEARNLFMKLLNSEINMIAIENPVPLKVVGLPIHSQQIQPYEYGHAFSKKTLLWLKNLPNLNGTELINSYKPYLPSNTGGGKRGQAFMFKSISQKESSKTFPGIAQAMADQWG